MLIRTKCGKWYVSEMRGVVRVSWVYAKDKEYALSFPKDKIDGWVDVVSSIAGLELEAVEELFV